MAKTKKCPACHAEIDAEAQHCPNCPHSFYEEEGVQEERKGRSKQPILWFAGVVLFFLAAWRVLNFVIKYANADDNDKNNPFAAAVERHASTMTARGAAGAQGPGGGSPEEEQAKEALRRALASGRVKIVPAEEGAAANTPPRDDAGDGSGTVAIGSAGGGQPPEAPAKEWRLRGHVYDLVTLKPVAHATVVLKDIELGRRFELVTGADGRYRTIIPSLPGRGYSVAIEHPSYAVTYLDPGTEGVREKSADERRELAQDLTHALDSPFTIQGLGKRPTETDFYLAPLSPR